MKNTILYAGICLAALGSEAFAEPLRRQSRTRVNAGEAYAGIVESIFLSPFKASEKAMIDFRRGYSHELGHASDYQKQVLRNNQLQGREKRFQGRRLFRR